MNATNSAGDKYSMPAMDAIRMVAATVLAI